MVQESNYDTCLAYTLEYLRKSKDEKRRLVYNSIKPVLNHPAVVYFLKAFYDSTCFDAKLSLAEQSAGNSNAYYHLNPKSEEEWLINLKRASRVYTDTALLFYCQYNSELHKKSTEMITADDRRKNFFFFFYEVIMTAVMHD